MGGSARRLKWFAKFIQDELKDHLKTDEEPCNMANSDRYVLYKVGPVLAVNVSVLHVKCTNLVRLGQRQAPPGSSQ